MEFFIELILVISGMDIEFLSFEIAQLCYLDHCKELLIDCIYCELNTFWKENLVGDLEDASCLCNKRENLKQEKLFSVA